MKVFRQLDDFSTHLRGGALAIGNFDGVHRGHAQIISRLVRWAQKLGGPAIVLTFEPHPVRILRPQQAPPPLTWTERKAELLAELGVDVMIAYPTDAALLSLSYREFFDLIVLRRLGVKAIVEGHNFYFGRNREGDVVRLRELCDEHSIALEIVEPLMFDNSVVSSSRIRTAIRAGEVAAAAAMLTHPYRIRGMVTHGSARGQLLGFPTANLDAIDTLIPAEGVYGGLAWVDHRRHWAAIHIGNNPTFHEAQSKVEVHILDFHGSIYGQPLEVAFVERIRNVMRFDGEVQLRKGIEADLALIRALAEKQMMPEKLA